MITNDMLRIHVINVGHGDSILVEFPDATAGGGRPRFGLVDAGGEDSQVRTKTRDYINTFISYRLERAPTPAVTDPGAHDYDFEFICLTHPHADHLYGMMDVLERFCDNSIPDNMKPKQFWDCGFRYNTVGYLEILNYLANQDNTQFMRVASGTEFHYDETEVLVVAPSVDIRNRYDTYGVDVNDASIVLRITLGNGVAILTGDAHFDTWGKVCEEFPRKSHITYLEGTRGNPDMRDPNRDDIAFLSKENQLNCHLLKVSHHGSKRGTSYEYIEKLSPTRFAISCDRNSEYSGNWVNKFPHPITRLVIGEESDVFDAASTAIPSVTDLSQRTATTGDLGTLVYRITRGARITEAGLGDTKHARLTMADFANMPA